MPHRKGFKAIVVCIGILGGLLLAEVLAFAYLNIGGYIPARQRFESERNAFIREVARECTYLDTLFPHPYLGFVHHGNPPCRLHVNNIGLFGADYPNEKDENHFVILLTGGSVAAQLVGGTPDDTNYLQETLNRRYISPNGKPFLILNGGDGAWKYPQQTILFMLHVDALDGVITLDGFNEIGALTTNVRFEYPAILNFDQVSPTSSQSYRQIVNTRLSGELYGAAANNWFLSRSNLAYLAFKTIQNQFLADDPVVKRQYGTTLARIFSFPAGWTKEKIRRHQLNQFKKYVRLIDVIAAEYRVPACHFLQPAPALGKRLTEEEARIVGDLGYAELYRQIERELTSQGVFSLLNVFNGVTESIYADSIHCRKDGKGYEIMAEAMANRIAEEWGLKSSGLIGRQP